MVIKMTIEIDNDVPMPEDQVEFFEKPKPKRKTRGRKKKEEVFNPAKKLTESLKFLKPVQKKNGTVQQQYCSVGAHWAAASNEVMTIGVKIEEDLTACPHSLQFIEALSKTSEELSITQLSNTAICVASGSFRAVVPCVPMGSVEIATPDEPCAVIDDRIKDAFAFLAPITTDKAPDATFGGVWLKAGSAVATNGHLLAEYWHGIDLPPGMLIPKAAVTAVAKSKKPLSKLGFSNCSVTFWFEDESFIKTQLYENKYPLYEKLFEVEDLEPWDIPEEFFKAIKAIAAFTNNGTIIFKGGKIASTEIEHEASTYTIEGLPEGMAFNSKYLLAVEKQFKKAHFTENIKGTVVVFFGDNVRGVCMGVSLNEPEIAPVSEEIDDDDIPF